MTVITFLGNGVDFPFSILLSCLFAGIQFSSEVAGLAQSLILASVKHSYILTDCYLKYGLQQYKAPQKAENSFFPEYPLSVHAKLA